MKKVNRKGGKAQMRGDRLKKEDDETPTINPVY